LLTLTLHVGLRDDVTRKCVISPKSDDFTEIVVLWCGLISWKLKGEGKRVNILESGFEILLFP
jgi:hypothetical protein